jgi:hypothetical protein
MHIVDVFDVVVAVVIRLAEVEIILKLTLSRARAGFNTGIRASAADEPMRQQPPFSHLYLPSFRPCTSGQLPHRARFA